MTTQTRVPAPPTAVSKVGTGVLRVLASSTVVSRAGTGVRYGEHAGSPDVLYGRVWGGRVGGGVSMTVGQDVKVPASLMAVSKVGRVRGTASVLRAPVPPVAVLVGVSL
ncbi:hypothetical protein [Streptosporangium saharense]|uniref:hypothetical protein n=1 Tax=Streptosporangium saharense TaxID=1706840 RepID=UPI0036AF3367